MKALFGRAWSRVSVVAAGAALALVGTAAPAPAVVGGHDITVEEAPYMATLLHFETLRCGAAVIDRTTLVTAGHCVDGVMKQFAQARVGATLREDDGTLLPIKRFSLHASYHKGASIDYDIAAIKLAEPLTFSAKVQPVALPKQDETAPVGAVGQFSGFGRTSEGGPVPKQLQQADLPVLPAETCEKAYGDGFTPRMLCAGTLDGSKGACQQDSGGPLVVDGKLVGISSWGLGCARKGLPGVYTKVSYFSEWIDSVRSL
ncbi:serine protease [Streptomyces klenkii]